MWYAWCNYGDSRFESMEMAEVVDWLDLEENEIEELEDAINRGCDNISFGGGCGMEWD